MDCGSGVVFCRYCVAFHRRCVCFLVMNSLTLNSENAARCGSDLGKISSWIVSYCRLLIYRLVKTSESKAFRTGRWRVQYADCRTSRKQYRQISRFHSVDDLTSSSYACVVVGDWLKPLKLFRNLHIFSTCE